MQGLPGSDERIEYYRKRVAAGFRVFEEDQPRPVEVVGPTTEEQVFAFAQKHRATTREIGESLGMTARQIFAIVKKSDRMRVFSGKVVIWKKTTKESGSDKANC